MVEQNEQQYQLYGRKRYEEPLAYVQTVAALDEIDKAGWLELVAVPQTAVIPVIPWEEKDE
jgi:hypothetical protein